MVRDEKKYQLATHYRKRGFSYSEIAKIVGVSKGTLSAWFAKKQFSKKVKKDNVTKAVRDNVKRISILNKAKEKERGRVYQAAKKQAEVEYKHYKANPLFIAGLMLYLASGSKRNEHVIRISESIMSTHAIFHRFLKEFMGVEQSKIHFWLLLYPDHREKECVQEWSKVLRLKPEQFYKNQVIATGHKKTLQYGVGNTIISNTVLQLKLNRWIELAVKELQK